MHDTHTHTGTLEIVERMKNSTNGNPRYLARVDGVTFCTKPDSQHAYGLTNYTGQTVTVTVGTHRGRLQLQTLRAG